MADIVRIPAGVHVQKVTPIGKVGVYEDAACATPLTSIDFGIVKAGMSVTKQIYVRNETDMWL